MLWFVRVLAASGLMVVIVLAYAWIVGALHVGSGGIIGPDIVEAALAFVGALVVGGVGATLLSAFFGALGTPSGGAGCLGGCATALGSVVAAIGLTLGAAMLSWRLEPGLLAAISVAFVTLPCVTVVIAGEEGLEALLALVGG